MATRQIFDNVNFDNHSEGERIFLLERQCGEPMKVSSLHIRTGALQVNVTEEVPIMCIKGEADLGQVLFLPPHHYQRFLEWCERINISFESADALPN